MFNRTTFGHISLIESGGITHPTEATVRKLADALDVPLHVICATEAAA